MKKQVTRFAAAGLVVFSILVVPVVGFDQPARHNPQLNNMDTGSGDAGKRTLTIGPGRVVFRVSPAGEWLGLVPGWNDGTDVITGGGFVVLAVDEAGQVVELANTATGGTRACERSASCGVVHEGIESGARYPMVNSDDDADGRENEDRLDGIDNDNDGRIDEDFAAVGDEMITLGYETRDAANRPALAFHQECYAWSLPHLDGMVAMKLEVTNTGETPINGLRIGATIFKPGDYLIETQDLGSPGENAGEKLSAKGILLNGPGETAVAALFFTSSAGDSRKESWLTGGAGKTRNLAGLLKAAIHPDALSRAGMESGVQPSRDNPPSSRVDEQTAAVHAGETAGRMAYGISPNLGTLQPGNSAVVFVALVAIPATDRVSRAVEDAYRTVVGDRTHRLVPPPMSITNRIIWGTYQLETGDGEQPVVALTLENLRNLGIDPKDITYLQGIDLKGAVSRETFDGNVNIVLPGAATDRFSNPENRLTIHGRLRGGEFFDLILRPLSAGGFSPRVSELDEATYWGTPGKLEDSFLTGSPNPFRESTTIFYEVPARLTDENNGVLQFAEPIATSVKIYNVAGRLVNVLMDATLAPGTYDARWDGMDDNGHTVASGVYYVKLQIGKKYVTKRLIQLK